MRFFKIITICFLGYLIISCKRDNSKKNEITKEIKSKSVTDTLITDIDLKKIGKEIAGREKKDMIDKYYYAINREVERPEMADSFMSNIDSLFKIYHYKVFVINSIKINSYVVKILFEDAQYISILLILNKENYPNNCLVVYENLKSEVNYNCYSKITNNIITINKVGNSKKTIEKYIIEQNNFLEYFENSQIDIPKWGQEEIIYTKDGQDSTYEYQYILEGKIKNHLKHGVWDEKKYILQYNKSVWLHGEYINGLRNGEWIYDEGDPFSKTEVYDMGKLIKIY
ncbi:hypothetical protein [Flavobacterium johnsoniae]|uniref:Uncharacterized protein n=1 Tax=Flavobacterium johnsoniae (strain ATCC 17061 / DSM 2064 / JCM 8514 / BCRC 14874 / CCUG 350202 / NBRC 14942 / NCIMB 11054 / UW101) TaxID=376686 RepID=A5FGM4_FLAJ1|nr:hypothetical protein [Flavobacterium johnsoniae]ABQ05636.1 hypothetical protein Fjoh_2609 [Flavobacterium johnsoniae UW101]OXG00092.1 hypothetical protein B0A63_10340 [Flavobacterium johnsoniae UW101]WQG82561.1 hypothetical protein SR927_05465 [Flavobacterium johnsoniae UW101]SHL51551.1 hypothetical protein SAMN05444146_3859 [Flavobacterium johnsoniae]